MKISFVILISLITYFIYSARFLHTEPLLPSQAGQTFFNNEQGQLQLAYQIATASPQTLAGTWLQLPEKLDALYQKIEQQARQQPGKVLLAQIDLPLPQGWVSDANPIFPLHIKTYFDQAGKGYSDFYINPQRLEWGHLQKYKSELSFLGINGSLQKILPTHQLQAHLSALHIEQLQNFSLKLLDWQLNLTRTKVDKSVYLKLPLSQYTTPRLSLLLTDLNIEYKAAKPAVYMMFTPTKLSTQLKQMQLIVDKDFYHLNNMGFGLVISQHKNRMNYHAAISVDKLVSPYLLGLDLGDVSVAMALKIENIDAQALELIRQVLSDWKEQSFSSNMQTLLTMITHQSTRLAKQGLILDISPLYIQTKQGDIKLKLTFEIDKTKPFALKNIANVRKALLATIDLSIDQDLLQHLLYVYQQDKVKPVVQKNNKTIKQVKRQITNFLTQQLLHKEGDYYRIQAHVDNGQLFINGREQPFPLL